MVWMSVFINLLGLYLMFCCVDTGVQPPKPSIYHLKAISDRQSLVVSWLVNHSSLVDDIYELQISRVEKHNVIYNTNVSVYSEDVAEWTWISDLPLECVDHSVRIRQIFNRSVSGPWSNWMTNYGFKSKGEIPIFPSNRVLREGTSATFCCVPRIGVNITSMAFRNNPYPLINIGAGVKAISVHNLTIPTTFFKQLLFGCKDSTGRSNHTWNYVSVPPEKPRNLSCETTDMTTVTCTWSAGRDPDDGNKQTHTLHIENSDQAPITCEPSSCTFPAVPQLQEYNISVVVKDKLGEETESYSFNISERVFPVVEWNMVRPEVTDATLSWHLQGNFREMNVDCEVSTIPGSIMKKSCYNVSFCKVKLEHLLPNTRYYTRARCSVNNRVWGEWTMPKYFTTSPLVTVDLWRKINQPSSSNTRLVTLLWKLHISGTAATVTVQGYTVKWSQEGHMGIEWKDSGHRQAEVSIGPGKCDFTVQADLRRGSSIPAHISIPPVEHTENPPLPKRLSSTAAGGFNLSWNKESAATCGYTVEWCILGNAVPCPLEWMQVPKGNNTLFLTVGNFKAGCRYAFNIYGCTENGHTLLETQTGYSQELKSVQSPSLVEPVHSTSSSVTLEWHYNEDDPTQPAFITGYLVTVQEVLTAQAAKLFNVSVADPQRKSVTVQGLQPHQEYICSVSALTKEGPGPQASITCRTKINYPAYLAKILTPILLVLTCTFLLWPQRKVIKDILVYPAGMNIKMHDSFVCETDYRLHPQTVDECITCDIEFVNTVPPPNEAITPRESTNSPSPPGFQGPLSSVPLQAEYCPQTAMLGVWDRADPPQTAILGVWDRADPPQTAILGVWDRPDPPQTAMLEVWDRADPPQTTGLTNKTYLYTLVEDCSEPQQCDFSEILLSFQPSDGLQECDVVYGYIPSDAS
ncbi:leukemia inhibitory factor receptor [Parambassis ranga]|uniref:Leukemia inhibitory factor receptor n=1 Tax=Parambassis ranga TaxID=210632 RepID=A0A6P7IXX7_9TELE|nr:leukemia inhibitory factor receptor-like [Parambassis ranga]